MADRFFQGYVYQLQGSIPRMFGVIDNKEIVSCSNQEMIGQKNSFDLMKKQNGENDCFFVKDMTYRIFYENSFVKFAAFVEGKDKEAQNYATILAVCFTGTKAYLEEKYDRALFYKNLFLENIHGEDVNVRASILKIVLIKPRAVFLLRFQKADPNWNLNSLLAGEERPEKYEVFPMTETDILLIAETRSNTGWETLEEMGYRFREIAGTEFGQLPVVGIGSVVTDIRQLAESYKESLYMLSLLYLFQKGETVISYNHLGINRLIYQMPVSLCESYLREVFIKGGFDSFEPETLETINCFFENNLNVSETARQLFIHRNTLMYRLKKVKKLTGLDIRVFDDAIIFKLAMVIYRHLEYKK